MAREATLDQLQLCKGCGRVAYSLDQPIENDAAVIHSPEYRAVIVNRTYPDLARRYVCLSLLARHKGEPAEAFGALLSAAWVADDENLGDLARSFRQQAAACIDGEHDLQAREKLRLVDVLRRGQDWHRAETLCEELLATSLEQTMGQVASFQQELISARDDRCYRVIDAVENSTE